VKPEDRGILTFTRKSFPVSPIFSPGAAIWPRCADENLIPELIAGRVGAATSTAKR
jgi:hypothetical protein